MIDKEIINIINDQFKNHKIEINIEQKAIRYYYNNKNNFLGYLYIKTNNFYAGYWFYNNLMNHFKNRYEMKEFLKPVIGKTIKRKINQIL